MVMCTYIPQCFGRPFSWLNTSLFLALCGLQSIPPSTMNRRKDKVVRDKQICPQEKLDVFQRIYIIHPKARAMAVISVQQTVQFMHLNNVKDDRISLWGRGVRFGKCDLQAVYICIPSYTVHPLE